MSKAEFMRQLEQLLADIPQNERIEALNYYEEYFSDAGVENEQRVLMELGSPWQVAQTIRDGLQTEMPFYNRNNAEVPPTGNMSREEFYNTPQKEKSGLPTWAIVLIVIACILGSPVIFGVAMALLGILIGVFGCLFGLIVGFGAAGIAMVVAGIAVLIAGVMNCLLFPMAGIILMGAGLVIFAIGILSIMFVVWLCGFVLPALCKGIASLFKKKRN